MSKNALQAQLLKAGLVDSKKAKKLNKQAQHAKRIGDESVHENKKALADAHAQKVMKDQQLNREKQEALERKMLKANVVQMIKQHQLVDTQGEVKYSFVDNSKVKSIYITQKLFDQAAKGQVVIARLDEGYSLLPRPLAERIDAKMEGFIIISHKTEDIVDEDDPYADYVIPDDLMW